MDDSRTAMLFTYCKHVHCCGCHYYYGDYDEEEMRIKSSQVNLATIQMFLQHMLLE